MEARSTPAEGENDNLEPEPEPPLNTSETTNSGSDNHSNSEYSDCDSLKAENSIGSLISDQALEPTNEAQYSTAEPQNESVKIGALKGPIREAPNPTEMASDPSEALVPTPEPLKSTPKSQESTTEPLESTIEVRARTVRPLSEPGKSVESNGSGAWRSVAFNLAAPHTSEEGGGGVVEGRVEVPDKSAKIQGCTEEKHVKMVKIHDNIEIHEASDTNSESDRNETSPLPVRTRKENFVAKKEIIGILKPPTPGKELRSFPSLPDTFLQDLGLIESMSISTEHLSEQDVENKFSSLSLAFKTDRVTLGDRLELQLRQRDISEKNVSDEIRQLKTTIKSLNRVCQDTDTRDILERVAKQISILHQSTARVASSSEQFGAVQQEMRISTAVEIMLLHLENMRRNYEREHSELEETRRILVQHKLIDDADSLREPGSPRHRSVSVMHGAKQTEKTIRRASCGVATSSNHRGALTSSNGSHRGSLTVEKPSVRPRSPTLMQMVSVRNIAHTVSEELSRKLVDKKSSIFSPIAEEDNKNDSNNNSSADNKNKYDRRRDSRRQSQFDVDTIIEEMDELAARRDSSPTPPTRLLYSQDSPSASRKLVLPTSPTEILARKKSLLIHLQTWYSELYWPYDEEETILGVRYFISGFLSVAAFAVLLGTFIF